MGVRIDQAGRKSGVAEVYHLGASRNRRFGAYTQDGRAAHHHQSRREHAMAVEHARRLEYDGLVLAKAGTGGSEQAAGGRKQAAPEPRTPASCILPPAA